MTIGEPPEDQHEAAESLPLLADRARVTEVEAFDHNRREEVLEALADIRRDHAPQVPSAAVDDDVDWAALLGGLGTDTVAESVRDRIETLRERFERPYPSLVRIRFDVDEAFDFVPGEYVTVSYEEVPRVYSIASSPNREYMEICVRRVPDGRLSSQLCSTCEPGDELVVRGPHGGDFVLRPVSDRDLVFLATGTGAAPFKSMIEYTFEEGRDEHDGRERDVWLILGASWEDDLPYRDRFRELDARHENFHFVPTLSREHYLSAWGGEREYVQHTFLKYVEEGALDTDVPDEQAEYLRDPPATDVDARIDPTNIEVYACGLNAMVSQLAETARAVGVPADLIRTEGYG